MSEHKISRVIASGWLVGPLAATGMFIILGFASLGFYVSLAGLLIAGTLAFMAGTGAAAVVDSRRGRNAGIVAGYIAVLFVTYLFILPSLAGPPPPGISHGGPGVSPPLPLSK
jgi:hypothetical protein